MFVSRIRELLSVVFASIRLELSYRSNSTMMLLTPMLLSGSVQTILWQETAARINADLCQSVERHLLQRTAVGQMARRRRFTYLLRTD